MPFDEGGERQPKWHGSYACREHAGASQHGGRSVSQTQVETVGKVFVVVAGMRRCVICNGNFTPTQAANHEATMCFPTSTDYEQDEVYS